MMRKPKPSSMHSVRCRAPEISRAWFGSATRNISLNMSTATMTQAAMIPARISAVGTVRSLPRTYGGNGGHRPLGEPQPHAAGLRAMVYTRRTVAAHAGWVRELSERRNVHSARRMVLEYHHDRADRDLLAAIRGVRQERLGATSHLHHHLADQSRSDPPRHPPLQPDQRRPPSRSDQRHYTPCARSPLASRCRRDHTVPAQ